MANAIIEDLGSRILHLLAESPNLKARDIAAKLSSDRHEVNKLLYGALKSKVQRDQSTRWSLAGSGAVNNAASTSEQSPPASQTPLTRLCQYYVDCISYEQQGVSTFAKNNIGQLDYMELESLPMLSAEGANPIDTPAARAFINSAKKPGSQKALYLGYPVRLRFLTSKKGWHGYFVEPIFLFNFDFNRSVSSAVPTLNEDLPFLNFEALKHLTGSGGSSIMQEVISLSSELGMNNPEEDLPEIDELFASLRSIRSEWDWVEDPDPFVLTKAPPLSQIDKQGIYNRAILITGERSNYTQGLEVELAKLSQISGDAYQRTALSRWIDHTLGIAPKDPKDPQDSGETTRKGTEEEKIAQPALLEVLPMNTEQRESLRKALTEPLTVITGPPGTGKSQVVTNLLINCAWNGQKVLFASKNNKAVDVVEERTNGLGSRPVLMRLGAKELQAKLAQYLLDLLATRATSDDQSEYDDLLEEYKKFATKFDELEREYNRVLDARNTVDRLEKAVCDYREELGPSVFSTIREMSIKVAQKQFNGFQKFILASLREKQLLPIRLFWPLLAKGRFSRLTKAGKNVAELAETLGLRVPGTVPGKFSMPEWEEFSGNFRSRLGAAEKIKRYFESLDTLKSQSTFEELADKQMKLIDRISDNSLRLWQYWIRLQPNRIPPAFRTLINSQAAILRMVLASGVDGGMLPQNVARQYYGLVAKLAELLPCWAVTSLSANKRIPFEPAFFDLLVIDEASQCDIASALPLLFRAKRVVVIGDPNQLQHISSINAALDAQLQQRHNIVEGFASWLYSVNSLFALASGLSNSDNIVSLKDHHRSHADIIRFSNRYFYRGYLRIATRYDKLRPPKNSSSGIRWTEVEGNVKKPFNGGAVNEEEAQKLARELEELVIRQGYQGTIGVVTPFRLQANRIREIVSANDNLMRGLSNSDFLVDVVHKFQGDERDVMFFSPVLSRDMPRGALWFLQNQGNLFNVAITRARAMLHVVGDHKAALQSGVEYLEKFAAFVEEIRRGEEGKEKDFSKDYGPNYPTVSNPESVSDWERIYYRALYASGLRPIPQYPVEQYLLDFAVIDGDRRLNIEVDGERYHRAWNGELCRKDQIRNQRLIELGWDVKRFWVYQIRDEMGTCVKYAADWMKDNQRNINTQ